MIPQEMHDFVVNMASHERIIQKYLDNYCRLNNLSENELHAVLSHISYNMEQKNRTLTEARVGAGEAQDLHNSIVNHAPEKVYNSAEELVDDILDLD